MPVYVNSAGKILVGTGPGGKTGLLQCCCDCWVVKGVVFTAGDGLTYCQTNVENNSDTIDKSACVLEGRNPSEDDFIKAAKVAADYMVVHTTATRPGSDKECTCIGRQWSAGTGGNMEIGGNLETGGPSVVVVATDANNKAIEVRVTFRYDVCLKMDPDHWRLTHEFYVILRWAGA